VAATLARAALAVLAFAIVAVAAAVAFGVAIDASRWRDAAAQQASAALGRPVTLGGALELTLGRELVLRIGQVRILNPAGFTAPELLVVGEAKARFDLLDALRGRPRLRGVAASDVSLWLERSADGRANWALPPPRDAASPRPVIDLGQISLQRVAIQYQDAVSATRRSFALDELSASVGPNDPLQLALLGRVAEQGVYVLKVEGGPLRLIDGGAEPWPFKLDLESSAARLHADGVLDARKGAARFDFDANADDVARIGALLGAKLPPLGTVALRGTVAATTDAVALTHLQGTLGEAELSGQLALAVGGGRPRLSGALSVAAVDLRPRLATDSDPQREPFDFDALALRELIPFDLDVDVRVDRWLGWPVEIRDARFALHADTQGLRVPLSATVANATFSGLLSLDTAAPTPKLALQLDAKDVALAELARHLTHAHGKDGNDGTVIDGTLGRVGMRLVGRGETLGAWLRDLEFSLALAAAQARVVSAAGGRPVAFTLDTLALAAGPSQRLRGSARGSLLGERATLSIRGGSLPDLLNERATPLALELVLAQATLRIEAALAASGQARDTTALRFDFQARRAGDLARWLAVAPESNLPVALRGRVELADEAWALTDTTLKVGRSEATINARRTHAGGRPVTKASVRGPLIDVPELLSLRASSPARPGAIANATVAATASASATAKGTAKATLKPGARLDVPIFSTALDLPDADLDLVLKHVLIGRTGLVDVSLVARTREGRLLPSTVIGKLAGAPFSALAELDLRGEVPAAKLDLSTGDIDLGVLLRGLGIADDIDGRAQALQLTLQGRGTTPREFAAQATVETRVVGGSLTVLGAAQRPVTEIRVNKASFAAAAGEPIRGRLDGMIDQTPVRIELSTGTFADFAGDTTRLPFALAAHAAGTRLTLDGEVTLPLGSAAQLTFQMSGERLDTLNDLAQVELPAWGPWSLRGPIRLSPSGYELQGLQLDVGESRVSGTGKLDISGPRPRLEVQVAAPRIQLDDFPLPKRLTDDPPPRPGNKDDLRVTASAFAGRTDRMLSAAFLRRFDASIDVEANEVLSGSDRLADGELHLKLTDGRLLLDPAVINLPGGSMRLSLGYDLKGAEVEFAAAARVERFNYGIIARRLGRADDLRGLFSLKVDIAGRAPSLETVMNNANGRFDFAVWPNELRSGVFKLWSVNLVLALVPLIDVGGTSQVNCIVGQFDLKDGDLISDKFVIDMTRVRMGGEGHANLATEELAFVFRPRAKGLALFRLQTPLRVTGTLTDQRFGHDSRDTFESVLRSIASPILLPIERFTLGPLPRDGADLCTDPLRASGR
jgi:uncharacterized protein involved in outer membrane biogenesis